VLKKMNPPSRNMATIAFFIDILPIDAEQFESAITLENTGDLWR
jgi:hypothetical protein